MKEGQGVVMNKTRRREKVWRERFFVSTPRTAGQYVREVDNECDGMMVDVRGLRAEVSHLCKPPLDEELLPLENPLLFPLLPPPLLLPPEVLRMIENSVPSRLPIFE